jgi:hypothetical protein
MRQYDGCILTCLIEDSLFSSRVVWKETWISSSNEPGCITATLISPSGSRSASYLYPILKYIDNMRMKLYRTFVRGEVDGLKLIL